METNIDLKKIWNTQSIKTPEVQLLYAKANKLKRRSFLKLIAACIILLFNLSFAGFIWYYYQPELITTKLGIILIILAIIIFLIPFNKQFSLLAKHKTEPNSKEYFQQLIKLKETQIFHQTTLLSIYFIMLSLGIGLYLIEYVSLLTITWAIVICGLTALWIAFNWFYIRPIVIKKRNTKLNSLLVEFEKLNSQMED